MACSCNKFKLVKPIETCLFCAHKHIASAMSLYNEDASSIDNSYIIGQLNLASWHYNSDFAIERDMCLNIINKINNGVDYKVDLSKLVEVAWNLVLENQDSKVVYDIHNLEEEKPEKSDIFKANIAISTANALYNYELNYKSINSSFAIGQLITAAWHLQTDYMGLAMACRDCWLKIEKLQDCKSMLDDLQKRMWLLTCDIRGKNGN